MYFQLLKPWFLPLANTFIIIVWHLCKSAVSMRKTPPAVYSCCSWVQTTETIADSMWFPSSMATQHPSEGKWEEDETKLYVGRHWKFWNSWNFEKLQIHADPSDGYARIRWYRDDFDLNIRNFNKVRLSWMILTHFIAIHKGLIFEFLWPSYEEIWIWKYFNRNY